ncbi:16S rRNA (guanine(966)-N(2))-methyltransferase RsmD [Mycoplasma sp. NEAQ87857]|uniref:16S rRNA (guanine(966)-N(2))-methyltransferase RsmD n=1 Tax=Mycoplasma sp. NEAQ87857 TaxID=2683967 RepID=UPI00131794FD|nr:16S rRNA (guanine(966)-N(2))-methyltransferase RsmD [Mycoplasma sp. NEAQ87857]QGZ97606.1 16S rRNA (guanine(966)-N(2))-methyltransferase RsmD [Mycoplasma sp. NEAQ87857]
MLRIIAGKHRNRLLEQPSKSNTRATTERVREAVFSSIQFDLVDKSFLDLFAGSGAWGLEAISRDASYVEFVDNNKEAFNVISANAKSLKENNLKIWQMSALEYLKRTKQTFDFIFIDAPFEEYDLVNQVLSSINELKTLNNNGTIIVETNKLDQIILPAEYEMIKHKRYGKIDILYIKER